METMIDTIHIEDTCGAPFFDKTPLVIERGRGAQVWDSEGNRYLDFTSGLGVASIGHASPVITAALLEQCGKIIQNPNSGLTYSPPRAKLLSLLNKLLPRHLTSIFFSNSGCEVNDAAIKLSRKASGRRNIISADMSFHGRTIGTISATGQSDIREKFNPLTPGFIFVPYDDAEALEREIRKDVAAVILEPIQGEGGIRVPSPGYLERVSEICRKNGVYLIMDEIQTGFYRTGTLFATDMEAVRVDFLTMAKGMAGGFPFSALAFTQEVAEKLQPGDHGGTYCGNPLGCATSCAVIEHLIEIDAGGNAETLGNHMLERFHEWKDLFPGIIADVRGKGLLLALEFYSAEFLTRVNRECLLRGLLLNIKHGSIIRIFPPLTITREEVDEGMAILKKAIIVAMDAIDGRHISTKS